MLRSYPKTLAVIEEIIMASNYFVRPEFYDSLYFAVLSLFLLWAAGMVEYNAGRNLDYFWQIYCLSAQTMKIRTIWKSFSESLINKTTPKDIFFCWMGLYIMILANIICIKLATEAYSSAKEEEKLGSVYYSSLWTISVAGYPISF